MDNCSLCEKKAWAAGYCDLHAAKRIAELEKENSALAYKLRTAISYIDSSAMQRHCAGCIEAI